MQIKTIPEDYIINAPMQFNPWLMQSDFVLKAVYIENDTLETIRISKISFELNVNGKRMKEVCYSDDALDQLIKEFPNKIKYCSDWDSKVMIGKVKFWNMENLSDDIIMKPNQEIGILNEFFIVVYHIPIDEVTISVSYDKNEEFITEKRSIPVIQYEPKNRYTFPVKGAWQVNGNYDCIGAHRTQYSMEFAFDLGKIDVDSTYERDEDYCWYGEDILAIAGGKIISCFNEVMLRINFPDDSETDEEVLKERKKIIEQFGHMPLQCGNYAIIKHDNGEYSLYGHMIYHSLTVKKGDFVKQGQIIGKIGNTGKSGCPHLHFQLMNGPDYSTARGLPCHFTNITDAQHHKLGLICEEYTIVIAK